MNVQYLWSVIICVGMFSCQSGPDPNDSEEFQSTEMPVPTRSSGEPNLYTSADGDVFLSWLEYLNDTTSALLFSSLAKNQWSDPLEIARGSDWFVNWADFPSMAFFANNSNHLAAHWLQKSAGGLYDYDIKISTSTDGGNNWSTPFSPHRDGIPAEHGFVTLVPLYNDHILGIWLDGRNTKGHGEAGEEHAGRGAMTLRAAEFNSEGELFAEAELDHRVCECCQTDAAQTDSGPVVVYRDRSDEEIRDISIVRRVDGRWTSPVRIAPDNWHIEGCPVNGPAVAALDNTVSVAWFSAANNEKTVKVAFSSNGGETFGQPIRLDNGNPVGRVDIELTGPDHAIVTWMEQGEDNGQIRMARVQPDGHIVINVKLIETGTSRRNGFPILQKIGDRFLLAWTHIGDTPEVRTLSFTL